MKTATVTWTAYRNYGTLLQAYALQQWLIQQGCDNEILSDAELLREFRAAHPYEKRTPAQAEPIAAQSRLAGLLNSPRRIGRVLLAHTNAEKYHRPYTASQEKCEKFKAECLRLRDGVSGATLAGLNQDYDAFLCGSDQVWSVFPENFDPYYYLDFVQKKKIAYAPCLGTDRIPQETAGKIRELLSGFTALSAREKISAEQLSELTGREVAWVCDPTLLHDAAFWSSFSDGVSVPRGKYLLCYFLEEKPWYFSCARSLAKRLHLKIRLIPNRPEFVSRAEILNRAVGPKEFVALFRDAAYILTDSYHGSVFSLIFQKDFLYLERFSAADPRSQNIRVQSLFDLLSLNGRIVREGDKDAFPEKPDYGTINPILSDFRKRSAEYLFNNVR